MPTLTCTLSKQLEADANVTINSNETCNKEKVEYLTY